MSAASLLHSEILRFRQWANHIPVNTRSGEWECDYPHWAGLLTAAKLMIATAPETWAETTSDDLLYALARDNEAEFIASELAHRPEILLKLAAHSVTSIETDAKWQIAAKLGELNRQHPEAEAFLTQLVQDTDEYVSRRALLALGTLKSEATETFAERAWSTGHEYQRIAALWSLKEVASPKLASYLLEAEKDGREYIVLNAEKIRAA